MKIATGSDTFQVSPEEKRILLASIAQADREEFVDGEELLAELDESNLWSAAARPPL